METVKENELDEKIQQLMEQRDDRTQALKKILKALDKEKGDNSIKTKSI